MFKRYIGKNFRPETHALIDQINEVVDEYRDDGFILTVRQLYYQLVARNIIPNTQRDYKRIAGLVNDAKLAGLIDWNMIEDRTRSFVKRGHWESPSEILNSSARIYYEDMWVGQDSRVFVIIEKEALIGVLDSTCREYDVPLLAARGYPSGSVLREFAVNDIIPSVHDGQTPIILHLGDHDPSGIDMSRDLEERIDLFSEARLQPGVRRIALNMDQIEELRPPENPAKSTDSRFREYRKIYGSSSWELDALSPAYLANLVETEIKRYLDPVAWQSSRDRIQDVRAKLRQVAENFDDLNLE